MRDLTTFDKAVYWHDFVEPEEKEQDLKIQVLNPCDEAKIHLKDIKCFDTPDCLYDESYDILFFDWGGMSLGNSMLEHFCRYIYKHAEDNPNKLFVMVSLFTKQAMTEAIEEFGDNKPWNLFLSIEDLSFWLDKHYED